MWRGFEHVRLKANSVKRWTYQADYVLLPFFVEQNTLWARARSKERRSGSFLCVSGAFPLSERNWIIDWLDSGSCVLCVRCCCCFFSLFCVFVVFSMTFCFQCYSNCLCIILAVHSFFRSVHDLNVQRQFFYASHFNLIIGDVMWKLKS